MLQLGSDCVANFKSMFIVKFFVQTIFYGIDLVNIISGYVYRNFLEQSIDLVEIMILHNLGQYLGQYFGGDCFDLEIDELDLYLCADISAHRIYRGQLEVIAYISTNRAVLDFIGF
jgi:hypothetical protein